MAKKGKRLLQAREDVEQGKAYDVAEAVKMLKERATARFDETVEIALNLGVDPRHADQMVRGVVELPHGTGKTLRVAVFARGEKAEEAQQSGADIVGAEDLAKRIEEGQMDFDRCIATPDGLARLTAPTKARTFSTSWSWLKLALPMPACTMPAFSARNWI